MKKNLLLMILILFFGTAFLQAICQIGGQYQTIECKVWKLEYWKYDDPGFYSVTHIQFSNSDYTGIKKVFYNKVHGSTPYYCRSEFGGTYRILLSPWGQQILQFGTNKGSFFSFTFDYIADILTCGSGHILNLDGTQSQIYAQMTNVTYAWLSCFPLNWTWPWDLCPD